MKLTQDQDKAIKRFLSIEKDKSVLLTAHTCMIDKKTKWESEVYLSLNKLSVDQLATALYVGYEVEEDKNERIVKLFANLKFDRDNSISPMVRIISEEAIKNILEVLSILEVKIEGIN